MKYITETYVARAREVHGDRYDYGKVVYVSAQDYIEIGCPDHGTFRQKARAHLLYGCKKCGHLRNADERRLDKQKFVSLSRNKHGNRYDYSNVEFRNQHEKVEIICPEHGSFWQPVNDHLKGHGCAKCGKKKGVATRQTGRIPYDWKGRAIQFHGDMYDYSESKFLGWNKKVTIICHLHGPFDQLPTNHLRGNGCPTCRQEKARLGFDQFVQRANERHGDKYDYVSYCHEKNQVGIVCAIHGHFTQRRFDHLNGAGCPSCANAAAQDRMRYTREEICDQISLRWGDKIAISADYHDKQTKTKFLCMVHGEFETDANSLLNTKHGCPRCAAAERAVCLQMTQEMFEKKANFIHGGKYEYGVYKGCDSKIEVSCPEHGSFVQSAGNHLSGYGCPMCGERKTISQHKWLDMMGVEQREVWIEAGDKRYRVDGYDPLTRTVYEFWGDFWHGNPRVFPPDQVNQVNGVPFRQLFESTLNKRRQITNAGYNLVEIWEYDWKRILEHGKTGTKAVQAEESS